MTVAAVRSDGWPLCPSCGQDELYSLESNPETIRGCFVCGLVETFTADQKHQLWKVIDSLVEMRDL